MSWLSDREFRRLMRSHAQLIQMHRDTQEMVAVLAEELGVELRNGVHAVPVKTEKTEEKDGSPRASFGFQSKGE